jgi:hypothetical protein
LQLLHCHTRARLTTHSAAYPLLLLHRHTRMVAHTPNELWHARRWLLLMLHWHAGAHLTPHAPDMECLLLLLLLLLWHA